MPIAAYEIKDEAGHQDLARFKDEHNTLFSAVAGLFKLRFGALDIDDLSIKG